MTAQISDTVLYRGAEYDLCGIDGEGLFEPQPYGIEPRMISTACWRGYYCTYQVGGDELLLTEVHVGLHDEDAERARRDEGPPLFGVRPRWDERDWCFVYAPVEVPVSFTGGLLLGRDFIRELYVHMGFHPGWKYREVHELLFEQGRLREAFDRSAAMEAIRGSLKPTDLKPARDASRAEVEAWIKQTFSLRYERG